MKRHLLLIAAGLLAVGCVQNQQPTVVATYANDEEKQIIDKMDCWRSTEGMEDPETLQIATDEQLATLGIELGEYDVVVSVPDLEAIKQGRTSLYKVRL